MPRLEAGQIAPPFTLDDQGGRSVSLSDFLGRNLIIFFYPAAMTPGCTKEACDFRDSLARLQQAGYEVVGISPDKPEKLARFAQKESLTSSRLPSAARICNPSLALRSIKWFRSLSLAMASIARSRRRQAWLSNKEEESVMSTAINPSTAMSRESLRVASCHV